MRNILQKSKVDYISHCDGLHLPGKFQVSDVYFVLKWIKSSALKVENQSRGSKLDGERVQQ